jgi:uncharacterized small protein (DUF1192 family)
LREKGHFTPEQAETLAEALGEAAHGDLATKADLAALRSELKTDIAGVRTEIAAVKAELKADIAGVKAELKADIAAVRTELKADIAAVRTEIAEVKADILKWVVGAIGFQTVVILAALVSLVRIFAK